MGVDQDAAQAFDPEALDETHAAHIGGQVVDFHRAFDRPDAVVFLAQVHAQTFDARHALVPVGQRLLVDGADAGEALGRGSSGSATPAMKPPAPAMTIRSSLFMVELCVALELISILL